MTTPTANELKACKLCRTEARRYEHSDKECYYCPNKGCALGHVVIAKEEWQLLHDTPNPATVKRVEELEGDKERLDWLERIDNQIRLFDSCICGGGETLREAIDAMSANKKVGEG